MTNVNPIIQQALRAYCPVAADLNRHLIALDRAEAREAEIERRANEYLFTGAGRNSLSDDLCVQDKIAVLLACLCASKVEASVKVACDELRACLIATARKMAIQDMEDEE